MARHASKRRRSLSSESSSSSSSDDARKRKPKKSSTSSNSKKSSRHQRTRDDDSDEERRRRRRRRREKDEEDRRRRRRKHSKNYDRDDDEDSSCSSKNGGSGDEELDSCGIVQVILNRFPDVVGDLRQLLQMIDNGKGVDVEGVPNKELVKLLKKLLRSLNLKKSKDGIFLLPPKAVPTLQIVGSALQDEKQPGTSDSVKEDAGTEKLEETGGKDEMPSQGKRRLIGPEMPSRELLAAAAELTEADKLLREADLEGDGDLLIGPPPPAMVAEAESANEAERFEEVSRIIDADPDKPYDVVGVNWKMSSDNIKKRYWKLSLLVHPDKCSHPQAHQAFVILNQAFKDLQDPDKRKAVDDKIKLKEEEEQMKVELRALREAAEWRKLQGISMDGDDDLLAVQKEPPKRDEWMTTLPPERKPGGVPTQSRQFSMTAKEGRGDTSVWTDNPLDKAQKAKQNYLEAYDKAKALGDVEDERRKVHKTAELVDKYNSSKRSVSLLQKHKEESSKPQKKKKQAEKKEWDGLHPWKPWDREKDLTAGRKSVNLDTENMSLGLSSRFSSGPMQRNFL